MLLLDKLLATSLSLLKDIIRIESTQMPCLDFFSLSFLFGYIIGKGWRENGNGCVGRKEGKEKYEWTNEWEKKRRKKKAFLFYFFCQLKWCLVY